MSEVKLRVGIDGSNLRRGGGRTHLIELLRAADPIKDQFDSVVIWGSRQTLALLIDAPWLNKVAVPALERGPLRRMLWQRFSLRGAAYGYGCDVLFVPGGTFGTGFRPIVTMSRNMLPFEWRELRRYGFSILTAKLFLLRLLQTRSFRLADGVIFLTDYARRAVLRVTGQPSGSTRIIPHGLNSRFLASGDQLAMKRLPGKHGSVRLIYVSIVDHYKHQWHVVEAVAKARTALARDLQVEFIGPAYAPAAKKLRAVIAQYDPRNQWAHYRGVASYDELHILYARAHVGIFASSCENMPNILLETMAAGLPIVSSNRGPMPEILGDSGLYFDPEKPDSLTKVLLELLQSEEKMITLGRAAYETVKNYSWNKCAFETFGFLRRVARSNSHLE